MIFSSSAFHKLDSSQKSLSNATGLGVGSISRRWYFNRSRRSGSFRIDSETGKYFSKIEKISIRRLVESTDQADPSCFYFKISWILMDPLWFYFFLSPPLVAGPQKPQKLTTSKMKYEHFGPKILIPHWKMDILVP